MGDATNTSVWDMLQQFTQTFGTGQAPAQGRNVAGGSGNVGGVNMGAINMPQYAQTPTWNMSNINQALPAGTAFSGSVIPLGQPQRETTAQDIADMLNQAVGFASQGGYNVPNPAPGMPAEDYNTFLSSLQNLRNQMQVEGRANDALNAIRSEFTTMSGDPALAQARQVGNQQGVDWDIYETMRQSMEANMGQGGAGANAASRGIAGSSASQLAGNQARAGYAGKVAELYPQALQATDALRTNLQQRILQPYYARQATGESYLNNYTNALRALYGAPEFILNS